ncbi:hypothetical protein WN944_017149 [Citrus x changshan-huyou]|uniref:Uncharacterized protein n=1 Tax=Citrus x changshan-huyou TaxID=2935761 RepID=A0AAP0MFP8_9ROSI
MKNYMRYVQGFVGLQIHKNKDEEFHSKQNIQIMPVMHALLLRFGM